MKKFIIFTFIFLLTNFFIIINSLDVSAHSTLLTVEYDDCIPESTTDGKDEVWYYLCETNYSRGPKF